MTTALYSYPCKYLRIYEFYSISINRIFDEKEETSIDTYMEGYAIIITRFTKLDKVSASSTKENSKENLSG